MEGNTVHLCEKHTSNHIHTYTNLCQNAHPKSNLTLSKEENHTLFGSQLEFIQATVEATVSLFTFILDFC